MEPLNGFIDFLNKIKVPFKADSICIEKNIYYLIILTENSLVIIYTKEWSKSIKYHLLYLKLYFLKNSIDVIYIHYLNLLYKVDTIKSKIRSILKLNRCIYARKTSIVNNVTKDQADNFIHNNCLYKSSIAKYKIGLNYNNTLVMLALFSKKRNIYRNNVSFNSYELIRILSLKNTNIIGGASKLIRHFINTYNPDDIMTYLDLNWYRSNSFSKLNFKLIGLTCTKFSSTNNSHLDSLQSLNLGSIKLIKYLKKI